MPENAVPDAKQTNEGFANTSDSGAEERTDSQTRWQVNAKRTYDVYQQLDLELSREHQKNLSSITAQSQKELAAINNLTVQALQNAIAFTNKVNVDASDNAIALRAQVQKHSDIAADGMWTDQLNPVERGAGNEDLAALFRGVTD